MRHIAARRKTMTATLDDYRWLTSDDAGPHLARAAEFSGELHQLAAKLRKELSAARAHLVIEQVELRRRAKEKFPPAEEMFFTRKGYEQATDSAIANYKAQRAAAIPLPPADLCCGIGGDLIALGAEAGKRGQTAFGVDLDPITAHLAAVNCERLLGAAAKIEVGDANDIALNNFGLIHIDPDRRADGARHTRFESLVPGEEFLQRHRGKAIAMKLASATQVPSPWADQGEREWIGSRGECRQQMLWLSDAARWVGKRSATIVAETGESLATIIEQESAELAPTERVYRYIYEPHAAVLAAGLSSSLAYQQGDFCALTVDDGYLTGDALALSHAWSAFEVEVALPFDLKQLKAALRERNVGRLEIKKRGISEDPDLIRKRLDLHGSEEATLVLARTGQRTIAVIAKRFSLAP
jgi:hypothetical protein